MTATNQQPVAEICSASHDDAQFGERAIKPLCDISGFEYGTPLYAGAAPAAVAPQGEEWRRPTTYLKRFGDAIALLCHGRRPEDQVLSSWLDGTSDVLQQFAVDNGPAWAQGIGLIDAATIAADQPTEGVAHEMRAAAAPALEAPAAPESAPWCPDVCPITGRPFFMWIDHWQTGKPVPTYGGPYDSYTIPVKDSDGSFECERYDHDEGGWLTEGAGWHCLGVRLVDDQSFVVDPSNPRYNEIEAIAAAAPQAPAAQVIENLLQLARIVNTAVEDWGESFEDGSSEVTFHKEEADKLEEILEFFDSLPDAPESEGVILSGPSRAARVLRAQAAPAAPAVDVETIEDAARFRAIVDAALTDDEAFDLALGQYPELGDDATIDDVRAMFDAARAAVAAQAKEGGDA